MEHILVMGGGAKVIRSGKMVARRTETTNTGSFQYGNPPQQQQLRSSSEGAQQLLAWSDVKERGRNACGGACRGPFS